MLSQDMAIYCTRVVSAPDSSRSKSSSGRLMDIKRACAWSSKLARYFFPALNSNFLALAESAGKEGNVAADFMRDRFIKTLDIIESFRVLCATVWFSGVQNNVTQYDRATLSVELFRCFVVWRQQVLAGWIRINNKKARVQDTILFRTVNIGLGKQTFTSAYILCISKLLSTSIW